MPEHLQLSIETPCHENWANMTPAEAGRHCMACAKTVVDFTLMSDQQLIAWFSGRKGDVCGRFMPGQLERALLPAASNKNSNRWWVVVLAGLLTASRVSAQEKPSPAVRSVEIGKAKAALGSVKADPQLDTTKAPAVKDSCQTLPAVTVIGYGSTTVGGKVMVGYVTTISAQELSETDSTKNKIKELPDGKAIASEWKVYPNPVRRGRLLHLAWLPGAGNYQVGFFNASGIIVFQQDYQVNSEVQTDRMDIPAQLAPGIYFLRAVRAADKKQFTQKLIVL